MSNLTLERRLVQALDSARSVPGHHTVILKEESGGRALHRVLPPGEPFRKGFLERFGHYEAYAVSASPVLRHRFGEQLKTGAGDRRDLFSVHVTVAFHVAQPAVVAERLTEDPLGMLDAEIKSLLRDWASTLTFDVLGEQGFDAEEDFLHARQGEAGRSRFETVQDLAAALGLEVQRVELTREYSADDWDVARRRLSEVRERDLEGERIKTQIQKTEHDQEVELRRELGQNRLHQLRRGREVLSSLVSRLDLALENVAQDTRTATDLRHAVQELVGATHEMSAVLREGVALPEASNGPALPVQAGAGQLTGARQPLLIQEVHRMVDVLRSLECTPVERAGLAGRIVHVLGALCLSRESQNGDLETHVQELTNYCDRIGLDRAIDAAGDVEVYTYFQRLRQPESLREELDGESLTI